MLGGEFPNTPILYTTSIHFLKKILKAIVGLFFSSIFQSFFPDYFPEYFIAFKLCLFIKVLIFDILSIFFQIPNNLI